MRKAFLLILCMCAVFFYSGCQGTKTRAVEGALIGTVVGAAAGGIIGHQGHHGAEGAAIGGAVGALTGAIVGSQIEKPSQPVQSTPGAQGGNLNQMSLQQIVDLTKQGIPEEVIIDKIRLTNSKYKLEAVDIDYLRGQGVAQKVVDVMQEGL